MPTTWLAELKLSNENDYVDMEDYNPYINYVKIKISSKTKKGLKKNIQKACWNEINRQIIYEDVYKEDDQFILEISIFSYGQNEDESLSITKNILRNFSNDYEFLNSLV
jgi:hypothetical protein